MKINELVPVGNQNVRFIGELSEEEVTYVIRLGLVVLLENGGIQAMPIPAKGEQH